MEFVPVRGLKIIDFRCFIENGEVIRFSYYHRFLIAIKADGVSPALPDAIV